MAVLNSWGTLFEIDRRKGALCSKLLRPRKQEIRLFLTAGGTLFEID
jgi:hypothetical protein